MRSQRMIMALLPIIQLVLVDTSYGQRWYMPPAGGTAALGVGARGPTPGAVGGAVGATAGNSPFSAAGAPPIGTGQPAGVGSINIGGPFGGGSVASNPQLNGALSNGLGSVSGSANGTVNGQGVSGTATGTATGQGASGYAGGSGDAGTDALFYSGAYSSGGYGGGGGSQFTQDPISAYATAYYSGMANLIRAQGIYEMEDTQAMINLERARTRYIDNEQKVFYARQSIKRAAVAATEDEREKHKADRARQDDFLAAHKPQPLSHEELDPSNGTIHWPAALMASDFDEMRTSLNDLFAQKARGYDKSLMEAKIYKAVGEMRDKLHQQILTIPLHDYSEARIFLDSMGASVH